MTSPRLLWLPLATLTAYQKDPGSVKYFQNLDSSLVSFKSTHAVWPWQISRCVRIHAAKFGLFFFISHNSSYWKVMFSRACVCSQGRGKYPRGERGEYPKGGRASIPEWGRGKYPRGRSCGYPSGGRGEYPRE